MQQTTLTFLDSYCERAGHSDIWAEPLNAVTNLLFMIAAVLCWRLLKARGNYSLRQVGDIHGLLLALFSIGIGSGLWHTYATQQTMLADVIPITLFINIYLLSSMRRILGFGWGKVAFWFAAYWALGIAAQKYLSPDMLNGTIMYVPTYVTLAVLTAAVFRKDEDTGIEFVQILGIFSLSLIFRTVDLWVCPMFPLGTHFLWHALNAWMLYRLLKLLIGILR